MKDLPLSEGFTVILEQNKKDLKIVSDYDKTVPYRVDELLKYYVIECERNFDLFDKCVKYSCANGLPLVSPSSNFSLEIQNCKFPCISATLPKPLEGAPTNFSGEIRKRLILHSVNRVDSSSIA